MMQPPENVQKHEATLGTYWFDSDGILNSISKSPTRTVENTRESYELVRRISNNQRVCLLTYLTASGVPDKATRDYVTQQLPTVYKAMAMVSKSGVGQIIMNFLFKLKPPAIPMKTFTNDVEARAWIKQYL